MRLCIGSFNFSIKLQFAIVLIFISLNTYAQEIFAPVSINEGVLKTASASLESQCDNKIKSISSIYKKDLVEIYKERKVDFKKIFESKQIYTSPYAQDYLNAIVAEIINSNPPLQNKNLKFFFSRTDIYNAAFYGEGLIIFNMGLFNKLDNESQVASILCHELAHFYFDHLDNSILDHVKKVNSDEFKQQLKDIKKMEYGKRKEFENMLKGFTFDSRRHGRNHESLADSMGLEFMKNTRFDIAESLTALKLLDNIDADSSDMVTSLKTLFNFEEYPFKDKWIQKEEGLLGGHAKLTTDKTFADSLKTHPDCKLRISTLQPLVEKYKNGNHSKNIINAAKFSELQNIFKYEVVEYAFENKNYTNSLELTISLLKDHPADPYLITQVGKIFNGFYNAQKAHTLTNYVDFPAPSFSSNYNLLLEFVQKLYRNDYAGISYNFLKKYSSQINNYTAFTNELDKSLKNFKE